MKRNHHENWSRAGDSPGIPGRSKCQTNLERFPDSPGGKKNLTEKKNEHHFKSAHNKNMVYT